MSRATQSILRAASSACSGTNGSRGASKHVTFADSVTFADDVFSIISAPRPLRPTPRPLRPLPPSVTPPSSPALPKPLLPKSTPSKPVSAKPASPKPRDVTPAPVKVRPTPSPRQRDIPPAKRPTIPANPPKPPSGTTSFNTATVLNPPIVLSNPSDRSSTTSHRRHKHHHHRCRKHDQCDDVRHRHRHNRLPLSSRRRKPSQAAPDPAPPTERVERAARQKRKRESGIVKKRTTPERRRRDRVRDPASSDITAPMKRAKSSSLKVKTPEKDKSRAVERVTKNVVQEGLPRSSVSDITATSDGVAALQRKKRRTAEQRAKEEEAKRYDRRVRQERSRRVVSRIKELKSDGLLPKARRFVVRALALPKEGYPSDVLDAVDAKTVFKLYSECRQLLPHTQDPLLEVGHRLQEGKLRRVLLNEEAELKSLQRLRVERISKAEVADEKKRAKRRRRWLEQLVADEVGSDFRSVHQLSKSQLEKAVLAAVVARVERFETRDNDVGLGIY